jgi:RNA polymerase sigma-B factor
LCGSISGRTIADVAKQKLSEAQLHELLAAYLRTRDIKLRDQVVHQYRNLVESIARRFAGSAEPLEDLVQEGYIGLITATDLYNAEKGVKFSTYATHFIIGQIKHALRDRGKIIKEPAWLQELNFRMDRVINSLYQELGRQPTETEIGCVMHLPEEQIADLLTTREVFKVASLDIDQDESSANGVDLDKVKDDKYTTFQLPCEDKIVLETAMNKLKIIEQKVIQEFYYTGLSQTEIAKTLGISCNYVSHILRNGTKKLRRILTTEEVKEAQVQLQLASRRLDKAADELRPAIVDSMTGLYSVEYITERLQEEVSRALRSGSELAFAILAVDGLDEFRQRFGAMRAEDTLYNMAQIIKDGIRRCDVAGRLGDYEFALVMPYTGRQSRKVCARLCQTLMAASFETVRNSPPEQFTVRFGCSTYPTEGKTARKLIALAGTELEKTETVKLPKAA